MVTHSLPSSVSYTLNSIRLYIKTMDLSSHVWEGKNFVARFSSFVFPFHGTSYKKATTGFFSPCLGLKLVYDYAWFDEFCLLFVLNVDIFGRVLRALKSLTKLHFKRFYILVKHSLVKFFLC